MHQSKEPTVDESVIAYLRTLSGANKRASSITAYPTDIVQVFAFVHATNFMIVSPSDVTRVDVLVPSALH
jgi:hypothetical protein